MLVDWGEPLEEQARATLEVEGAHLPSVTQVSTPGVLFHPGLLLEHEITACREGKEVSICTWLGQCNLSFHMAPGSIIHTCPLRRWSLQCAAHWDSLECS